jgi:hypothetical protein
MVFVPLQIRKNAATWPHGRPCEEMYKRDTDPLSEQLFTGHPSSCIQIMLAWSTHYE